MLLETSVCGLSEDVVILRSTLALMGNLLKCNSDFDFLLCKQQDLLQQTTALIFPICVGCGKPQQVSFTH